MRNLKVQIIASILLGLCLVGFAYSYSSFQSTNSLSVSRESNRHEYGNPKAPIRIVEFSDFQCPYCARLHPTLKEVVDESDGGVVWEFRHLPLQNHPLAYEAATISECVADLAGEEEFWLYSTAILADIQNLSRNLLYQVANEYVKNPEKLSACTAKENIKEIVNNDMMAAEMLGARGTPFNVVIFEDGTQKAVPGALPKQQWKQLVSNTLYE